MHPAHVGTVHASETGRHKGVPYDDPGTDSASRVVSGESSAVHPRAILGRRNATEVADGQNSYCESDF